jgi:hypothetical protein
MSGFLCNLLAKKVTETFIRNCNGLEDVCLLIAMNIARIQPFRYRVRKCSVVAAMRVSRRVFEHPKLARVLLRGDEWITRGDHPLNEHIQKSIDEG